MQRAVDFLFLLSCAWSRGAAPTPAAQGSTPSVSLLEAPAGGGLSLLCVSEGWYPPPELLWTDETGADWRAHFTTNEEQDSTGLVTVRSQIHLPRQQGHAPRQQNTMICVVRSRDGATELKTVMNIAEDCDISMQWAGIASSILAAVICIPVLLYFTRKPTKEKEDLQKQNETLKKEKRTAQEAPFIVDHHDKALYRDDEEHQQDQKKEALRKQNDHLKRDNERLGKEKEALQKQNESLKQGKEKVEAEKAALQKNYDTFKKKNEKKTPTDNSKAGLENDIKVLEEDLKELRRKTNMCGYALDREWNKMTEARVNVTLDPDTASPSLTVSEDGSRVRSTGERSAEWPSVLGKEGFTSGMHYWEVEVGEKGYWVLGVSTHPHEKSIPEKPEEGYWLVRLVRGKICTAVSQGIRSGDQSGDQILKLEKICKVWGVYLDHEGGRLSFCNALTRFHIHTLEGPLTGQVYPIFSPGSHDKGPLIIQRVQHTAANLI